MSHPTRNRSRLLLGSATAALALALALPQRAEAQAIQAAGEVVQGTAAIDTMVPGQTIVDVTSPTVVIDWFPNEDVNGNALDFLPTGTTAIFQSGQLPDFAVLNRILPATNGNIAVIDGTVISRILGPNGAATPGGFVAFYSPTGILVGQNAVFDVGSLMLTTLEPDVQSFDNFAVNGGTMFLAAAPGSTAQIQISPGAQILASQENSFFAAIAADVQMLGTATINGSHAYVAGEVVNLTFSNGLFDIVVPVGTAAGGAVVELDGTVGGPASSGAGDNHLVYAVARAATDPISLLLRGNLGFAPAQQAGIVNGEIIIAANHHVFGRTVDGGSIADGINAVFDANSATSATRADIFLDRFDATSSLLAIGTHVTQATASLGASAVAGNLLLVGRERAELTATANLALSVTGDVLVSSQDYGIFSSGLQDLTLINAQGGQALIEANSGGTMTIGGSALITADAFAGAETFDFVNGTSAGSALGGNARLGASAGSVTITGNATITARAVGSPLQNHTTGAESRGGLAQVFATQAGSVTIGQNLSVDASATGAQGSLLSPSSVSDAFGGQALMNIFGTGGTLSVNGFAELFASATGGSSNTAGAGSIGDAGLAVATVDTAGDIAIVGSLTFEAEGRGGANAGGTGGTGLGGRASAATFSGGSIIVGGRFEGLASGTGGDGTTGGAGFGGITGANALLGSIELRDAAAADAAGFGGSAQFGLGGNGGIGRGGTSFFQADGTLTQTASLSIALDVNLNSNGVGGDGGAGDGQAIAPGRGGDGFGGEFSTSNQADPNFQGGAFLLAGGDNGTLAVGGSAIVSANASGGGGGFGVGAQPGGQGGNGLAGLAQAGLALLGQDGSVGLGSATFDLLVAEAVGVGGTGGFSTNDFPTGAGGTGTGGRALLQASAGDATANSVTLFANGLGGDGARGGDGIGGPRAGAVTNTGGTITLGSFAAYAHGAGGAGFGLGGGNGQGGEAFMGFQGGTTLVTGDVIIDATGFGGSSFDGGNGGTGTGGIADLAIFTPTPGSGTITGNAAVIADGIGGGATAQDAAGGDGLGGRAYVQAQAGGTVRLGSAQVTANGRGGSTVDGVGLVTGGNGTGGTAELLGSGAGSLLIIERNVTNVDAQQFGSAILSALGSGADSNGGTGIGGSGTGGTVRLSSASGADIQLPTDPASTPDSVGPIELLALGIGGGSLVEGGSGGTATGGTGELLIDGGLARMGTTLFSVYGQGGSSLDPAANIAGGNATGGNRQINVINGGELTLELIGGMTGGIGGDGSGTGNGGNAAGGASAVTLNNGTLNIIGGVPVSDQSTGGSGNVGGTAVGGQVDFLATNATITFAANTEGRSALLLGSEVRGGTGIVQGGNATGENVTVALDNVTIAGGNLQIDPRAFGGDASGAGGIGGDATGGNAVLSATGSSIGLLGGNLLFAEATGGSGGPQGTGGQGGNAASGSVIATFTNSQVTVAAGGTGPGILHLDSSANGGTGDQSGSALSDTARLQIAGGSLAADEVRIAAEGFADAAGAGQVGGAAQGGTAEIAVQGGAVINVAVVDILSSAGSSAGGTARAGMSALLTGSGSTPQITIGQLGLQSDALGGSVAGNFAGRVAVEALGGTVNVGSLTASALGDALAAGALPSSLVGDGGSLLVSGTLVLDTLGDIAVRTGQGGIIGGPSVLAPTAQVFITSQGAIRFAGDNDNAIGFGGQVMQLSAREIDIAPGARIGAEFVDFTSLDTDGTAILGGTTEEAGFTLTADEATRIEAGEFTFFGPSIASNDPNLPDILIRDVTIAGTFDDGVGAVRIFADPFDGIVRIEGAVSYLDAAASDLFSISAQRIEVVTPGGIGIVDPAGQPGGILSLNAQDIWAADADTIAQLQADPAFAGRNELLAVAAAGSDDPLGYLRGNRVELGVGNSLLVRNTGAALDGGGILVGSSPGAGLSIFSSQGDQSASALGLDVFAYGRRQRADGTFVTGPEFFSEVNFNRVDPSLTLYLDASAFNDCVINTGECPVRPDPQAPIEQEVPGLTNPTVAEGPITLTEPLVPTEAEEDEKFGMDFPGLVDAPMFSEDPLLDDPVASGGDSSLYVTNPAPTGGEK